jgi:hypothetical protein
MLQLSLTRAQTPRRYYLLDGTPLGNGYTSNSNPYAHWAFNYWDTLMNNPTYNCTYSNFNTKYFNVSTAYILRVLQKALQRQAALSMRLHHFRLMKQLHVSSNARPSCTSS